MLERSPTAFTRLIGRNGELGEYNAPFVPAAEFCVTPTVDAHHLGYAEVVPSSSRTSLTNAKTSACSFGHGRGSEIKMSRVDSGAISFIDVDSLAHDIMQTLGLDAVLGRNLPRETSLGQGFTSAGLRLEMVGAAP